MLPGELRAIFTLFKFAEPVALPPCDHALNGNVLLPLPSPQVGWGLACWEGRGHGMREQGDGSRPGC